MKTPPITIGQGALVLLVAVASLAVCSGIPASESEDRIGRQTGDIPFGRAAQVEGRDVASFPPPRGAEEIVKADSGERSENGFRGRLCLNGLWRFLPWRQGMDPGKVPQDREGWGWFKVPGIWPRQGNWEMSIPDQEILLPATVGEKPDFNRMSGAWYARDVTLPDEWKGRRTSMEFTGVQTSAVVFVNGRRYGEVQFPGGELDLTDALRTGGTCSIALLVHSTEKPGQGMEFLAPERAEKAASTLKLRGVTGDVYLNSRPTGAHIGDNAVTTSVRNKAIQLKVDIDKEGAETDECTVEMKVFDGCREVIHCGGSIPGAKPSGSLELNASWETPRLWDIHTPGNTYEYIIELRDGNARVVDRTLPVRFGFREVWTEGRDIILNGSPIHLRSLYVSNISDYASRACEEGAMVTCDRARSCGFNMFITSNYGFKPGQVGYMDGLYSAADRSGMILACSMPHAADHNWLRSKDDESEYRRIATWIVRRVRNHPSILFYAMNHNATGYHGDQNPQKIDEDYSIEEVDLRSGGVPFGVLHKRSKAEFAAAIVRSGDPSRIIYHHQSGNLGDMYTINTYLNWAPIQERSDWIRHWSSMGTKPLFLVEWGMPHVASWSSYRGPGFIWRTNARQQVWDSEYAAAHLGDAAYEMTRGKKRLLDEEVGLWSSGGAFNFGRLCGSLQQIDSTYLAIQAMYMEENWRDFRAKGLSAILPWDQNGIWTRRRDAAPRGNPGRYSNICGTGIVPDTISPGRHFLYESDPSAYDLSPLGRVFRKWNGDLVGFIVGKQGSETDRSPNYRPGDEIDRQAVIVNDRRERVECSYSAIIDIPGSRAIAGRVSVPPGSRVFIPLRWKIPSDAPQSSHLIRWRLEGGHGSFCDDERTINVLVGPSDRPSQPLGVELYDPVGATRRDLMRLGCRIEDVEKARPTGGGRVFVLGRSALAARGCELDLTPVEQGARVVVFEQPGADLEWRFGLRTAEHGFRNAFVRSRRTPLLDGIAAGHLRDWKGSSTLVPAFLTCAEYEIGDPKQEWCGYEINRVWRCGNVGTICSVAIEKPDVGDWLPVADCGFDLQYSPLLVHRIGRGVVVLCQADVSGRTQSDPAADRIVVNALRFAQEFTAAERRMIHVRNGSKALPLLRQMGFSPVCSDGEIPSGAILVVSGGDRIGSAGSQIEEGLKVLCLDADQSTIDKVAPGSVMDPVRNHSEKPGNLDAPEFDGLGCSDLHWRTSMEYRPIAGQADGNGTPYLRRLPRGKGVVVICQIAPWMLDGGKKPYLRTSFRRNSFLIARILSNMGGQADSGLLANCRQYQGILTVPISEGWRGDADRSNRGLEEKWWQDQHRMQGWTPIRVPGMFDAQRRELRDYDGVFWYANTFPVSAEMASRDLTLDLGPIDDESMVWLNGVFLGEMSKRTDPSDYWTRRRTFVLKKDSLAAGANHLVIRVNDLGGGGGMMSCPRLFAQGPWLKGMYLQDPELEDYPYRYYRW